MLLALPVGASSRITSDPRPVRKTEALEEQKRILEATVNERTQEIRTQAAEITAQKDSIELLSEIGKEITASLDLETILFKLYERVNQIADASIFGVGLYRPEKHVIEYSLAIENGKRYAPYTRSTDDKNQLAVWCIDNRQPILINDVAPKRRSTFRSTGIPEARSRWHRGAAARLDDLPAARSRRNACSACSVSRVSRRMPIPSRT